MRVATADGYTLEVEAHGGGTPLIFSCGLCTTLENWRPQVESFANAGMRVLLWDYRGQGRSDAPEDPDATSTCSGVTSRPLKRRSLSAIAARVSGSPQ